ncbi:MAG: helix-turn-helix domain-containing protein [Bacteroidales bacterium]|nr:helix-turn-helix domain-containing protein [Bacteroidales bacterium]MCM1148203.1 helix-turn-helix domain-containing protein [Bacteroidales bacterium]MCM1207070.1 helix-turn-helix domain-containing protein [Bacillota bacterium]MCM1510814.1 helix-turn-helix domain-containing protein [Clostridium sp.]
MKTVNIDSVQAFNDRFGFETLHPLVSVAHFDGKTAGDTETCDMYYGLYALFLKETKGCNLSYGRTKYDFDEMTVTSFAPGQIVHVEPTGIKPKWTALVFHPDFLVRTQLGRQISRYEFFHYSSSEALHLSTQEVEVFRGVLGMIEQELHHAIDKHTRELIVSNIELLLNYCLRFYDRQFTTREEINHGVVQRFSKMLDEYVRDKARTQGLPTVAYFADKCCLSTGYFGELVKAETGRTAKDFITDRLLLASKEMLSDEGLSVTHVSDSLGFEYPQHFVRFFKRCTGMTPTQFRTA